MTADAIGAVYREHYGRVLASLIRSIGDFDLAEEVVHDAFEEALLHWPTDPPRNACAWLIGTAKHRAIDVLRRRGRYARIVDDLKHTTAATVDGIALPDGIPDERLRLIFTCCHPALGREAQVALALRTLCGLTTDEIARAFLVPVATMAQRLVRAKNKIQVAGIPYEVPPVHLLGERVASALAVVYLVFNEGYAASSGDVLIRSDLCREAIRLARIVAALLPEEPEARGLLALLLLHDSRRAAREDAEGNLVLLEEQDRSLWNAAQIEEGLGLVATLRAGTGPYALQAAIAAEHVRRGPGGTDWRAVVRLYDALLHLRPDPVVELNRAIAVALAGDLNAGLEIVRRLQERGDLADYHFLWAAEADLLRRLGRVVEARASYERALKLSPSAPERRFLERRLAELA